MKLERALFQKSHFYFIGFSFLMLVAFWLSYFSKLLDQENYRMHLHGSIMILWCVLLISQAYLIRAKKFKLHRIFGKASYFLVALIAFSTIDLFKFRLSELSQLSAGDYLATSSVLMALFTFLIFYGLAIYYKKKLTIHARFMICTVFALFTAVIDRILYFYFPFVGQFMPNVDGPVMQVVGLTLGDILLVLLSIWDWRSHRRFDVFPIALAIHLVYHYAVLNFYKFEFWRIFSDWFYSL